MWREENCTSRRGTPYHVGRDHGLRLVDRCRKPFSHVASQGVKNTVLRLLELDATMAWDWPKPLILPARAPTAYPVGQTRAGKQSQVFPRTAPYDFGHVTHMPRK